MNEGYYTTPGYRVGARGDLFATRAAVGGGHGHDPRRPELHAFFLAAGAGVRSGTRLGVIRQTDIAPTLAKLLGVELPGVEGRAVF